MFTLPTLARSLLKSISRHEFGIFVSLTCIVFSLVFLFGYYQHISKIPAVEIAKQVLLTKKIGVPESELSGIYVKPGGSWDVYYLQLNPNGTYYMAATSNGLKISEVEGQWTYRDSFLYLQPQSGYGYFAEKATFGIVFYLDDLQHVVVLEQFIESYKKLAENLYREQGLEYRGQGMLFKLGESDTSVIDVIRQKDGSTGGR